MDETLSDFQPPMTPGSTALGERYVVERELGRGGMATVYLARDLRDGGLVAVKLLLPELSASVGAERFLREIDVGRKLQHPGIVGVLDSGDANGQLYYVMPFVEGQSLRDRLNREQQLPIDEAIQIATEVAEALAFAHEKGVIHRDIKPENILLGKDGAVVADFGIAHAMSTAGSEMLTRTGMSLGTPTYMSPEQALQSRDVTPASDVYSLGCVLYEMLAGQPPFSGPTAMALLARHSLDNVPSLKIVRGTIPDAVEDTIGTAMAKVPADRFRTATEFAEALRDDAGAARRRENSMRAAAAARQAAAAPAKSNTRTMVLAGVGVAVLAAAGIGGWAYSRRDTTPAGLSGDFAKNNVAVLYFEDRTAGHELGYVADGLTEAVIRDLSGVPQLKVISRNGVAPYRGKALPPDSIARALKIGTLVTGTVTQVGAKLRVEMVLSDPIADKEISTTRIEQPRDSVIALQDSLAADLSRYLRKRVGGEIATLVNRAGTTNSKAWEAMERAQEAVVGADALLATGGPQAAVARLASADTMLAAVETIDPSWARPIIQRGWIAYRTSRLLGPGDPAQLPKWIDVGMGHAERALKAAPNDADALELRGTLQYWRWLMNLAPDPATSTALLKRAEADLTAATVANKVQASAFNSLSHLYLATSRTSEGKLAADAAYRADPYLTDVDKTLWRLASSSVDLNLPNEAQRWCAEGGRRFPSSYRFVECRLWLYTLVAPKKPAPADIWHTYDEFVKATPPNLQPFVKLKGRMMAAIALVRAGLPDSARSVAKSAHGTPQIDPAGELIYLEAIVHAQLGDKDDAVRLLTRYLAANPQQRAFTSNDETWWFSALADDPKYKALTGASQ